MRPPNPRMSDSGAGRDSIKIYTLGVTPGVNQDSQGNWIRTPVAGTTFLAVVTPSFATGVDSDGSQISITTYQVMLYTNTNVSPVTDNPMEWYKAGRPMGTLVAMGEAAPSGAGAWAFQAKQFGPNPDESGGMPEGA